VATAEEYDLTSELTVAISMSYMNSERHDQWTCTLICASRSMNVWNLCGEFDKPWPLCSPRRSDRVTKPATQTRHPRWCSLHLTGIPRVEPTRADSEREMLLGIEFSPGALKIEIAEVLSCPGGQLPTQFMMLE
jgi:hypothetical protein